MANLRVGLAGAGVFGGFHAGKIASAPDVTFAGVFDPNEERAAALAQKHNTSVATDFADLLNTSDALIIATPATTHEAMVSRAISASKHVLIEKPLALTSAGARRLVREAEDAQRVLQVGHQERLVLKAMGVWTMDEAPLHVEAIREGPASGRAGDVSCVFDLMIHDLDLLAHLSGGSSVLRIVAKGVFADPNRTLAPGERPAFDHVEAEVSFNNGLTSRLVASRMASQRRRTLELELVSGRVEVDFLTRRLSNTTPHVVNVDVSEKCPDPLGQADLAFFAAASQKGDNFAPATQAVRAVALAEAIDQAAAQRFVNTDIVVGSNAE